ncbi:MAG: PAS domain S-box protein [Candidatus Omnitrophota bacterium]|nr:PAS domain S-box protein [Candidatus Omnitrophota bacterium]
MDESKAQNNHIKTDINNITESERAEVALQLGINELEQRVAERTKALKKSETLLFEMATQVPGVVYQFYARPNGEMGFYYISDRSERILGLKPDLGGYFERFTALVIPEYREGFIKSIEKAVKESSEWKYEGILQKPSGEKIWFFGNSTPTPRENEIVFNGIVSDITERKQAEEILKRERDNLSSIFEVMSDGVYIVDQQYDIQYVNRVLQEEYGSWTGVKCYTYFHDRTEICSWCPNQKVFAGETVRWEWYSEKNGKTYDLIDTLLKGPDKSILKLEIFRDITKRKKAEEALRESEVRHKELLIRAAEGIAAADLETMQFHYANPSMCRMFGYTEEELTRLGVEDIHPKKSLDHVLAEFKAQARGEKTLADDLPCLRKDGTLFYANVSAAPTVLGGHKCLVGFFTDVTERKQVESQREAAFGALRESERKLKELVDKTTRSQEELKASYTELKMSKDDLVRSEKLAYTGRIAASIAHEIRNPLTNVSMSVRQLKRGGRIKPEGFKHSEIIERNVERINFLITELLNCARPAKFNPQFCDMHQVIEDALIADKGKIRSQKVKVAKFLSAKPSILKIDKEHMGRVLLNLISNAVDAMSGGGNLTINTEINNDLFLIKVQDSGKGIPEKDIIRIFDPFFSTKPQGVGLGLTTCYGIIVSHGGTIEVESKWRKGTTFIVSLPIAER